MRAPGVFSDMTLIRRFTMLAALLCAAGALAACGGDEDSGGGGGAESAGLAVTAQETGGGYAWDPADLTAAAGSVTIAMENPDSLQAPHSVAIEGDSVSESSDVVDPGATAEVTADLEPGMYTFFCTVGSHRAEGMEGTLTVE